MPKGEGRGKEEGTTDVESLMRSSGVLQHAWAFFGVLSVLDVGVSVLLFLYINKWEASSFSQFFPSVLQFSTSCSDVVLLAVARLMLMPTLAMIALGWSSQSPQEENIVPEDEEKLLPASHPDVAVNVGEGDVSKSVQTITTHDEYRKNAMLGCLFVVATACQVYVGVKVISFHFVLSESLEGVMMGSGIFFINMELFLLRGAVNNSDVGRGKLHKKIHNHPIALTDQRIRGYRCNMCRQRITEEEGYYCSPCDFRSCMGCFKRRALGNKEHSLRGDKGARQEKDLTTSQYFIRALGLAKNEWPLLILAFSMLAINSGANLLTPNYQGRILDSVIKDDRDAFVVDLKTYLCLAVAIGFCGAIRNLCFGIIGRKIAFAVRCRLFAAIIVQDIAFFDGSTSGELTSRLTGDANAMVAPCRSMLSSTLTSMISLLGGIVMCFYTSWRLSVLAFTTVGPIVYLTNAYARWSRILNREIWAANGVANSAAAEAIGNVRTVRAFSTEDLEILKYTDAQGEALSRGIRDAYGGALTFALTNYLDLGAGVLVLWYGGSLALDGEELTVGKLVTFQLYWNRLNNAYKQLNNLLTQFTRAAGAAQRVFSLLDSLPDIDPNAGAIVPSQDIVGEMELDSVDFFYQQRPNQKVLSNLRMTLPAGKVTAIVGRSGGGKTTIINLLMRFYDPKSGTVRLDGRDIKELSLPSLHDSVGIVSQDTQIFATTVEENIAYGVKDYTEDELYEAAHLAHAHEFIQKMEDGYATRVGERGVRLSGGQKQRIAIARVLLRKPRIMFLDEATSALDTESEALVQGALDDIIANGGCTVVLVAHRLSTVVNADQIAVIDEGQIVEIGTHDELISNNGVYAKLVARQLQKSSNELGEIEAGSDLITDLMSTVEK